MNAQIVFRIGEKYNWKGQPERLSYLGYNWAGNGYWHQFEKVDEPGIVWCEVRPADLAHFEETTPTPAADISAPLTEIQRWNAEVEARKANKKSKGQL